jgi:hypothetical protein
MAHFSEDPLLVDAYKAGEDVHKITAMCLFKRNNLEEVCFCVCVYVCVCVCSALLLAPG